MFAQNCLKQNRMRVSVLFLF